MTSYQINFERRGDIETMSWAGSFEEVRALARQIASQIKADVFRIIALADGAEVWFETVVSDLKQAHLARNAG
jgi:hypothetical protein